MAVVAYASLVAVSGMWIIGTDVPWVLGVKIFRGHWFLWTYIGLMLISPVLDRCVEMWSNGSRRPAILLFVLAFGWGFVVTLPWIHRLFGSIPGLGSNGIISFMGIYVCADCEHNAQYIFDKS